MDNKFFPMKGMALSLAAWLLTSAVLFAQAPSSYPVGSEADSLALLGADWHWTEVGEDAQAGWAQVNMFSSVQTISVVRFPARKYHTELVNEDGPDAAVTSVMASRNGGIFAINGGYFTREVTPSTFVKDDGEVISSTSEAEGFRVNGILLLDGKRRTRMEILSSFPSEQSSDAKKSDEALTAGPMLVEDGVKLFDEKEASSSFYGSRHPRSVVGYTLSGLAPKGNLAFRDSSGRISVPEGPMVYFIVIDGRFPGQADGATIPEAAFIARVLGLHDALNLDGGGSSTLWTESQGVINHPCDNRLFDHEGERKIPNILLVRPK